MGRQDYLTRLALGRGAFRDNEDDIITTDTRSSAGDVNGRYVQQYDAKGRPVKPATGLANERMRDAQNSFQALFGVINRRDEAVRLEKLREGYVTKFRHAVLKEEDYRGETLDFLTCFGAECLRLWPDAFLDRLFIGYYDVSQPFAIILQREITMVMQGGPVVIALGVMLSVLQPLLVSIIKMSLVVGIEQVAGRLQLFISKRKLPKAMTRYLLGAINGSIEVSNIALNTLLLPIEYEIVAHRLRLAPITTPPRIFTRQFWSPGFTDFHSFAWKPMTKSHLNRVTTSAAALLLLDISTDPGVDSELSNPTSSANITSLNTAVHTLRNRILQFCGWTLAPAQNCIKSPDEHANFTDMTTTHNHPISASRNFYRSTSLAQLPALTLARAVDRFIYRLLRWPVYVTALRAVATSYVSSPLPQTMYGLQRGPYFFHPFMSAFLLDQPWGMRWQYVSKIGLAIGLTTCIDALLFAGTYYVVSEYGKSYFGWGVENVWDDAVEAMAHAEAVEE